MRIALIGPVPPQLGGATSGGVATHQLHLAAGLAETGIYAPLLATNTSVRVDQWRAPDGESAFPMYRMSRPGDARLAYLSAVGVLRTVRYGVDLRRSAARGSRREVLKNALWYRRFLAAVQPDLVHVQHPLERHQYVRLVQRLERCRLPVVVTAHSLFGEHTAESIETVMAPNLRAADRVIAVSPHIAEQAMELGVRPDRVRVIRSGVDVEQFQPRDRAAARARLGLAAETALVLFVGNLEPRKQVDVLLRAMAQVCHEVRNARVIVIGTGTSAGVQDQTARLLRLSRDLQLDDAVQFVGHVADAQLLDYYAAADVFALPSSSEAQGLVALEAMACGLPVVATAVGGLIGTIDDGRSGFLVPPGNVDALADQLTEVLREPSLGQSIGVAARDRVMRDFTWPRAIAATLAVYSEVLG